VSLDLELDVDQQAIARSVAQLCKDRDLGDFSEAWWKELAALGVLSLATPEGMGGAQEIVAAMESLGYAHAPGPLAATFTAAQMLGADRRAHLVGGEELVSLGSPPLMPWAVRAQIFIALEANGRAFIARPRGGIEPVETLGGEPWGRLTLELEMELEGVDRALTLGNIARAAQLAALGRSALDAAVEHAKLREQFGHTLGEFQAISHPLADSMMRLHAARMLARRAAHAFDAEDQSATSLSAAALLSASNAAIQTAQRTTQTLGALGVMIDGPIFPVSRRIRQLASEPPGEHRAKEILSSWTSI
jgi:alkylation response protein AidB-like acyl-CoA dehydrogenase